MNNIHLIPTDKPSRLFYDISLDTLVLATTAEVSKWFENKHIYITSDEETLSNNGDYYLGYPNYNTIHKWNMVGMHKDKQVWINKIILTTDQDLIKDGVQSIDNEFLEWFVKNPSCERVEVESNYRVKSGTIEEHKQGVAGYEYYEYKIIIPKDEAKQFTPEMLVDLKQGLDNAIQKSNPLFPNYNFLNKKEEPKYTTSNLDNEKYKDFSVSQEEPKLIKCYCGHTTTCDCGSLKEPIQETLEEFALKNSKYTNHSNINHSKEEAIILGAKWQQERMYSEDDLRNAYRWGTTVNHGTKEHFNEWFEQFKKK
jgi:hypothetical protein